MSKTGPLYDKLIRDLAKILDETKLTEIEYEIEGTRVRVSRQAAITTVATPNPATVIAPLPTAPTPEKQMPQKSPDPIPSIKSPMVGTAYLSSAPGEKTFVGIGSKVKTGDTLLIIEAMKVMNPIRSPKDGVVKSILVNNGEPVEFDQPLITLE